MSSRFGNKIKVSIFGQSHSDAIGAVIEGLPSGFSFDFDEVLRFMKRRAPGQNNISTQRKEGDFPRIISGISDGFTTGDPLCAIIENSDTKSVDYSQFKQFPRPSHADYPSYIKTNGFNDIKGGGHSSGRLTAPLCFAGALCIQLLKKENVYIGAHIASIGTIKDDLFDPVNITQSTLSSLKDNDFPVISNFAGEKMKSEISKAKKQLDSVGGIIECAAINLPVGIGSPIFCGIENQLSSAIFGIPAVRGIEFGLGFDSTYLTGSLHNDEYYFDNNEVKTKTNNHGGILGGMTTGMPIVFRVAIKPTASIGKQQETVDLIQNKNAKLTITGRHDPCIVPRAVPCVEAACAIVLMDFLI